jgi:hypothetical protein
MTPQDEEFLIEVYRNLDKRAVPPTSARTRSGCSVAR